MPKKRKHHQETLAEFEDRKDKVKFESIQHVYDWLNNEFNKRGLFYRYFLYYEKLKHLKHIKTSKVCAIVDTNLNK